MMTDDILFVALMKKTLQSGSNLSMILLGERSVQVTRLFVLTMLACAFFEFKSPSSEPANQPTTLIISNRTTNSISLSFTNASDNPTGYLVIYKIGSSPTNGVIVDGTVYAVGNILDGGIVGGRGNGPFILAGLAAGQQYFFDIYSYNGSNGSINYLQSVAPLEGNAWTLAEAPTGQPTLLTFDLISSNGFTGAFKEASPIPLGGYFILRKEASPITDVPVDGLVYAVGATIGASTVAFIGSSLSFTEGSLTVATTYYYKIFSFAQGSDPTAINYYTSGTPLVNHQTTFADPVSIQATKITFTEITNAQITLSWTKGSGARRIVIARAGSTIDSYPVPMTGYIASPVFGIGTTTGTGNFVVYDGIDSTVVVTGLGAGTTYYFEVFEYNGVGLTANYLTTASLSNPSMQITVPPIPVIENASNEQPSNFIANWLTTHGASGYELDVTLKSSGFSTFVNNYNGLALDDSTQNQQVVSGLASNTIYQYRLRARNAGGVSGNSESKIVLTSGGTAQPPTIAISSSTGTNILAQTANGFNPATNAITFLHRKITENNFTSEPEFKGSSVNVSIDSKWLDQLGVEYYFRVTDEANFKDSTANQFSYSILSNINLSNQSNFVAGGTSQSYRIFSIPMQLQSNRIEDIFQPIEAQYGGASKSKWRVVHYQEGQNTDFGAGLSTIDQGKSYWFNSLDKPQPINLSGSVTQANQEQEFILSLDAGFTQIGNPYPFNIFWNDVLKKNANVSGIDGVGALYTYDAAHTTFNKDASIFEAWGGGFVHSDAPIKLTIPVVVAVASGSGRKANEALGSSVDQPQWFVPLRINQGVSYNNYSGIGMSPESQIGYDLFDDFTPPRFVRYLEMNSYHPEYFTPKFCRDVVPTANQHNWNFDVESNLDESQAIMTWDNRSLLSNEAQLLLYDPSANVIVDMKKEGSYSFEIHEKHSFKIFFGVDEKSLSPDITALSRAYPNPFTTMTTIPFITSADRPYIQISLYDMMGRKIHDIVNDQYEPGYHEGIWDGADDQGGRAAQGLYIYRLTGTNVSTQVGKIILK